MCTRIPFRQFSLIPTGERREEELKEAAFVFERRYLIVKWAEDLSGQERADL